MKTKNKNRTKEEMKKEVGSLLQKEEEKREKLKTLGINYEYPGYKGCISTK